MYTTHGHHIPYTTLAELEPSEVARCGGPTICPKCRIEASQHDPGLVKVASPQYHRRGGDMDYLAQARALVVEYIKPKLEKTDEMPAFGVYVVWFSKTLQNWKALVSTTLPDGMYYEVTYNGDKREAYIDVYKKFDNVAVPDEVLTAAFAEV